MDTDTIFGVKFPFMEEIYLDAATVSLTPTKTIQAINNTFLELSNITHVGTSAYAISAAGIINSTKKMLASFLAASRSSVAFVPNRALMLTNWLFANKDKIKRAKVAISNLEEHSLIAPVIQVKEYLNFDLEFLKKDDEKDLVEKLKEKIENGTRAVILSSMVPINGIKRNYKEIIATCRDNNTQCVLDISNLIGHEKIALKTLPNLTLIEADRGLLGPTGLSVAILPKSEINKLHPLILGNFSVNNISNTKVSPAQGITRFETEPTSIPLTAGLRESVKQLSEIDLDKVKHYESKLRKIIVTGLESIKEIEILEDPELQYGPILSFTVEKFDAFDISIILEDMKKIIVRSGAACSSMFINEYSGKNVIRISTHLYNTEEEIAELLEGIQLIFDSN